MLLKLLVLFIGVPLIEVAILVRMGAAIGFWPTILIQIGTGALGASLARLQGFLVWARIQRALQEGRVPAEDAVDGILILAAGLVLLTPGLLTDAAGFLILIPATRRLFKRALRRRLERAARRGSGSGFRVYLD